MLACLAECVDTTRALLAKGANPDHAAVKSARYRSIHIAAHCGNAALIKLLLESGASENARLDKPELDSPLHLAVAWTDGKENYVQAARTLLRFSVDPDAQNGDGSTALHMAIKNDYCDEDMVRLLLYWGASIDKTDESGHSLLYYAIKNGSKHARTLWDPRSSFTEGGITALFQAACSGKVERVKHLLDAGCDKTVRDSFGRTAFDVARNPAVRNLLAPALANDQTESQIAPENRCPKVKEGDVPQPVWNCNSCSLEPLTELFYHCCNCSPGCKVVNTFNMCPACFQGKRGASCREENHKIHKRFVGTRMTLYEEFSLNIAGFGREIASDKVKT